MINFSEFFLKINELLDNPVHIKWIDGGDILIGEFSVNSKKYFIKTKNKGGDIWSFKFYKLNETKLETDLNLDISDRINVFRVLPTIEDGFIYLIDNKNPKSIIFGASDNSKGRKKLYDSFSQKISKKYNFEYKTNLKNDKQIFILYKSGIDLENLFQTMLDIIEDEII
jgi:hypothetical protein